MKLRQQVVAAARDYIHDHPATDIGPVLDTVTAQFEREFEGQWRRLTRTWVREAVKDYLTRATENGSATGTQLPLPGLPAPEIIVTQTDEGGKALYVEMAAAEREHIEGWLALKAANIRHAQTIYDDAELKARALRPHMPFGSGKKVRDVLDQLGEEAAP